MKKSLLLTVIFALASAGAWADEDPVILPWGSNEPWQMKFVKDPAGGYDDPQPGVDANGLIWTQPGYDDSSWGTLTGPMANGNYQETSVTNPNYTWEGENHCFCLRRTFTLNNINPNGYTFAAYCDDAARVYVNGQMTITLGCSSNIQASLVDASFFYEGENQLAICFNASAFAYNYLDYTLFSGQLNYIESGQVVVDGLWYSLNMKNNTAEVIAPQDGTSYSGSIVIPGSIFGGRYTVTSIGSYAFHGSGIETITIPSTIKSIGGRAFGNCGNLGKVYIKDLAAWCNIVFDGEEWAESNPLKLAGKLYLNGSRITALTIPATVTEIKNFAFWGCKFSSLTIPNTVTRIGDAAFRDCNTLRTATINNVSETGCQLASIGNEAFQGCGVLQSINFIEYSSEIGEHAFEGCGSLTEVRLNDNLTNIQPYTFNGCGNLNTINIPLHLESIGNEAFRGCGNLHIDLDFPEGLTSIGNYAFSGCTDINKVNFPSSLVHIGDYAFSAWGGTCGFHSLYIPAGVTFIGSIAFAGLNKATSVIVAEDNPNYDSRDNCNAIIETRTGKLLAGCRNTFIPEGVTYIDHWAMSCLPNSTFILPNTVEEIKENAFSSNSNMSTLVLGSGVTDIDRYICHGSVGPVDYYCYATDVPMADGNAFDGTIFWDYGGSPYLHVPAESIEDYRNIAPWDRFPYIVPITGDERFTVDVYLTASFDNSALLNHYNGYDANVTLERTFHKDGKWNTLCLPFSVTAKQMEEWEHPLREATIVRLEPSASSLKADGTLDVLFVKTDNIEAGKPYLVKWEEGDDLVEPVFKKVLLTCTEPTAIEFANEQGTDPCKFVGQFSPFYVTDENIGKIVQLSADNQPFYSTEPETLFSSLAHFEIDGTITDGNIKFRGIEGTGVDVEIGPSGYATFSYGYALDFTGIEGLTAYVAVGGKSMLTYQAVGKVPGGTGLLLAGEEGTYQVPVIYSAADINDNLLVGTGLKPSTTLEAGDYLLQNDPADGIGFYQGAGKTLGAGKAYLHVDDASGVKSFSLPEDNATSIQGIEISQANNLGEVKDDAVYNLAGQRVLKPAHGVYVVGGKKIVIK